MANNKIDRINKEIAKTREKITEYQNKLKGLEAQKTEAENLEIVQLVRAMRMTPQELNAMLKGGTIPGMTQPRETMKNRRTMQMKNKFTKTMTALCAALILMGGFSVPAYAQGAATEPPAEDATNDSNVVVEEPETPPLTPKGNATLVDDFGGNKQLITVTTKGGNYFYILIDRAAEGEQTVHFLNQVDEADLMALTETGEATKKPEVCNCTEKCEAGKVNTSCPVCATTLTGCTGKEPTPTPTEQPEEPKEKGGNPGAVLALVLFVLLGGGAVFYYFKFVKPKQNVKGNTDLEDFDFEDYDEDEPEADTGDISEDEETEDEEV